MTLCTHALVLPKKVPAASNSRKRLYAPAARLGHKSTISALTTPINKMHQAAAARSGGLCHARQRSEMKEDNVNARRHSDYQVLLLTPPLLATSQRRRRATLPAPRRTAGAASARAAQTASARCQRRCQLYGEPLPPAAQHRSDADAAAGAAASSCHSSAQM